MNLSSLMGNPYLFWGGVALVLLGYAALVHYWPTLSGKLGGLFGARASKELTREHDDLEAFAADVKAKLDAATAAKKAAIDAITAAAKAPPSDPPAPPPATPTP